MFVGLQHLVLFPASPYGMPLDFTILPQKLKESGSMNMYNYSHSFYSKYLGELYLLALKNILPFSSIGV